MFMALVIKRTAGIPNTDAMLGCPDWSRGCQELCRHLPEDVILPIPAQADRLPLSLQDTVGSVIQDAW